MTCRVIIAVQRVTQWVARRTGLYRLDVALALRKARQLDELAAATERAGLAESTRLLRESASRQRAFAAWQATR